MEYKKQLESILEKLDELSWEITDLACHAHEDFLKSTTDEEMNRRMDLFQVLCECDSPIEKVIEVLTKYQEKYGKED